MDPKLLDEAAARGVISGAQRAELEALQQSRASQRQDERIKTVGSFNEIFVTIGVLIACGAVQGLTGTILSNNFITSASSLALYVIVAEYFHRGGRFRLPIIVATLMAALSVGSYAYNLADQFSTNDEIANFTMMLTALPVLGLAACRYQLPFLMLPIAITFTIAITFAGYLISNAWPLQLLLGTCGLAILAFAVRMDLRDPTRTGRASDFAFWSYMVGSPLFVHSLLLPLLVDETALLSAGHWLLIGALVITVTFAGVLLNRRAFILSTMIYVGYVIFNLLRHAPIDAASITLITLLVIGVYMVMLGSRWAYFRRALFARLPAWKWLKKMPML